MTSSSANLHPTLAPDPDDALAPILLIIVSALICLGGLMVFSAGASIDQNFDFQQFWKFSTLRRLAFVPIAWLVLAIVSRLNYRRCLLNERHFLLSPALWLIPISAVLLIFVLIPGIGSAVNDSYRWFKINVGPMELTFQPSELGKWSVIMFLAAYCVWRGEKIRSFWAGFLPGAAVLLAIVGLIGTEDFGTAFLVGAIGVVVLLAGGVRWWHCLLLIPIAALAFYVLVYCNDYRWARVIAFVEGAEGGHAQAGAYQANQSITAIASGGLWGKGLGRGTMKLGWVPEDTTDFVFAVIGEELGFVGAAIVICLFVGFLLTSLLTVHRTSDRFAALLAVGIAGVIGAQAVMNLAVVTGLGPTKGIALPFVSAGGSGLIVTAAATGVLVNIARRAPRRDATQPETD